MNTLVLAVLGFAVALAYFTVAWAVSLYRHDASVVDVFWGPGFLVLGLFYALLGAGYSGRKILVVALVAIWGLRLAWHIYTRNRGRGEDFRYQEMRARGGSAFWWRSLISIFWLQAVLLWIVAAPLWGAQRVNQPAHFSWLDIVGAIVWAVGFAFEAVGDAQLRRFKADPANKGRVMQTGLWAYTRHPNYFGESLLWWGIFLIALGTPFGFVTIVGPILITFLLLRVSGVTLLEKSLQERKPGYDEYVRRTSAFIPRPPRK